MWIRLPTDCGQPTRAPDAQLEVLASQLRQDVEVLAGQIGSRSLLDGPQKLLQAAQYIEHRLEQLGYRLVRQEFTAWGHKVANLAVERTGTTRADQIVLVGAHYDTVPGSPGADDNATGVAALLAIADRLRSHQSSRTLRLVAFVNEEPPFFQTEAMGALVYAQQCRRNQEHITAMLSLESLGYYSERPGSQQYPMPFGWMAPNVGNFIAFISNGRSELLLRHIAALFAEAEAFPWGAAALPELVPGVAFSDHWAFWQQRYPAVMVTDTAMYRNPFYHTAQDSPETIDWQGLARVVRGLTTVVQKLVG
ncbi:MAG: M20/M25/M40 family metallo-hydrolase [Thermoguttaceae bacterium]|nr:M20/M25/M40 family metallo-hydrolase [Thermoguttaceae bacterium]MDW8036930.1 M20/M25/M40 family metallo-hydrolase [Thermoguttaceae bacterium]